MPHPNPYTQMTPRGPGTPSQEMSMSTIVQQLKDRLGDIEYKLCEARVEVAKLDAARHQLQQAVYDAEGVEAAAERAAGATDIPGEVIIRELEAAGREMTIHEISHRTGLQQQKVSDALRPLVKAGDVIKVTRGGYQRAGA